MALLHAIPAFADNLATIIVPPLLGHGLPIKITKSGSYQLSGNVVATNTTAISISAPNVTLDLNGNTVSCTGCQGVPGIVSSGAVTAIKNGAVTGFGGTSSGSSYGIQFQAAGGSLNNVSVTANYIGVEAGAGADLVVSNSSVTNNSLTGISSTAANLTVINTVASGNALNGIEIANGLITGSTITGNGTIGNGLRAGIIYNANGGGVNVTNCIITNNSVFGIADEGSGTAPLGYGSSTFGGNAQDIGADSNLFSMKNNVNAGGVF
jgi:hypothetical protein